MKVSDCDPEKYNFESMRIPYVSAEPIRGPQWKYPIEALRRLDELEKGK